MKLFHQQPIGASQRSGATQTSRRQAQELRFPIQEQQPQLLPELGGAFGGTSSISLPNETEENEWLRDLRQGHNLPHQSGDGNQASGWSGSFERLGQDAGQRTALRPLSMRSPQAEDYRLRSRSNFPTEEEGQDADQEYRRRAIPTKQKENVTEHFCGTQEQQSWDENFRRQVVQL